MADSIDFASLQCGDNRMTERGAGRHVRELAALAAHFDYRADRYAEKYCAAEPRHLYEHEKRVRTEWTCQRIDQIAERNGVGQLLDVGCGDGRLIQRVLMDHPYWHGTGIDVSAGMIRAARGASWDLQRARRVQWCNGTLTLVERLFDVVVALGVVGYQTDQLAFLRDLASRVRTGGLLIFTFANAHSLPRRVRTMTQSIRRHWRGNAAAVQFQTLACRQVDDHLEQCGLQRVALQWLGYGLGLRRGGLEVKLSRWCEHRWGGARRAQSLAQVGLVCYQRHSL